MSRKAAFGGIYTGLAVILLYAASVMPVFELTLYILSSLPVAFVIIEAGIRAGFISYAAASLLSFFLLGKTLGVLPFVLFFGHYGIFKFLIEKNRNPAIEIVLKLLVFNGSLIPGYYIFSRLLMIDLTDVFSRLSLGFHPAVLLAVLQPAFIMYDYIFSRIICFYFNRLKK